MNVDAIKQGMRRTWDTIGGDLLQCVGETGTMTREEVIESVLDADYIKFHGDVSDEDYAEFMKMPYDKRVALCKTVFTSRTYGW